tara:strand:- start:41 stop:1216 length:1176 start_codon:yes stop_codon:yes gene_type:complete
MPPPGGKPGSQAEQNFANFMTSTAGGTQGSSSYSGQPSGGADTSAPNYPGNTGNPVVDQAVANFQNQQQTQENFEQQQEQGVTPDLVKKELEKRKEKDPKNKFVQEILNLGGDISSMGGIIGMVIQGGAKGLDVLFQKLLRTKPTPELLNDPRTLAVLNREFAKDPTGNFKKVFEEKYADIIKEAYEDNSTKQVRELSDSDFFDEQLQENAFSSEQGILGAGSQRINFPEEFYTGEKGLNPYGAGGMPQTSGDLANLAGLAVTPEMQGANPELAKMIFAARMELDRMGKNPMTGESQGQPQGIPSIPGIPSLPVPKPGPKPPDSYPLPGQPPFMPGPPNFMPFPGQPPYGSKFEKTPYDYYAQSPQYKFRGVPSLNTEEFNEQLRKLYGVG